MERRDVLMLGIASLLSGVRGVAQRAAEPAGAPAAIGPGDGELVFIGRDPVRIKLNPSPRGPFGLITQEVSPGTTIPVHLHEQEDELIFIQSGRGEAILGDATVALTAGATLFVPRGTWHGGRNTSAATLNWVAIYTPSGFEGYFREIGRPAADAPPRPATPEEREARDRRYGIRYRR